MIYLCLGGLQVKLPGGHSSYEPTPEEIAGNAFGGPVSELAEGRAYRLSRRDLPLDHPARRAG